MHERAIAFPCGGDTLFGILHEPASNARGLGVLIIVGGPQYRVGSHRQFVLMARALATAGYPVLRFDYRGMGDSSGEPRSFDSVNVDVRAAIDAFISEISTLRGVALFGLCDAATAALIYSPNDARVKHLILANPWVRTKVGEARAIVRHYYRRRVFQRSFWKKALGHEFNAIAAVKGYLESLKRSRSLSTDDASPGGAQTFLMQMEQGFADFRGRVLVVLSGRDLTANEFLDYCRSSEVWTGLLLQQSVRAVTLPDADHTFSTPASLPLATSTIVEWLSTGPQ